ncbi:MAG: hypothetical protein AAF393_03675 [Pseudomonadota bacterium]
MSWLTAIKTLLKLNKLDKHKTDIEKLHDFAIKAERLKKGKVKVTELKAFSDKTVNACKKSVAETAKAAKTAAKTQKDFPKTNSLPLYLVMDSALAKYGATSPKFKKAEDNWRKELKSFDKKLGALYKELEKETGKLNKKAEDFEKMAEYCRKVSQIFQNLVKLPDFLAQRSGFLSLSRAILGLAVKLSDLSDVYKDVEKKNAEHMGQIIKTKMTNSAWLKKKFKDSADMKRNQKADKPH